MLPFSPIPNGSRLPFSELFRILSELTAVTFLTVYFSSQLYSDAESSFAQVLKLDKHCEDAMFELARVRVQQLEVCSSLAKTILPSVTCNSI